MSEQTKVTNEDLCRKALEALQNLERAELKRPSTDMRRAGEGVVGPWKQNRTTHTRRYPLRPDGRRGSVAAVVYQVHDPENTAVPGWQVRDADGTLMSSGPEFGAEGRAFADRALSKWAAAGTEDPCVNGKRSR